tara:strand:- start:1333 stop:1752 length:420 start_codon:yes stop_codon:yes gene_type:complete
MNQELINTTRNFITLVKHGLITKLIIENDYQSEAFFEWLMLCSNLPNSCTVEIYTSKNRKQKKLKENESAVYKKGVFFLMEEPVYGWYFDKDGIIFEPIAETYNIKFVEWTEIFMYDLRVQMSIGYILHILKKQGDFLE